MKKSFHIFQRDLSRLLHNKAAILVLIGVCLLPSLYAWFNIAANLDPYGNTSKIKVAIACLDKEASSENLSINAGKEIVKNLKENKQLGWTFTSEKEALNGVKIRKILCFYCYSRRFQPLFDQYFIRRLTDAET